MTTKTTDARRRSVDKVSCPQCAHPISAVVDSRGIVRLRICDDCGASYTTRERVDQVLPPGTRRLNERTAAHGTDVA